MIDFINYKDSKVRYKVTGNGQEIVVLLHGYLESLDIWQDFGENLSDFYTVISFDLPGHGQSEAYGNIITMEGMADCISHCLKQLKIEKVIMVGHSMGGYVTMAFADKYPENLSGLCLFHSTPFADNDEKKSNRNREIGLIKQGKKELIYNVNIPKVFAEDNLEKFAEQLLFGIEIAKNTSDQGIIAALEGMKLRSDKSHVLIEGNIPTLFIIGEKDQYIPSDALDEIITLTKNKMVLRLKNSGHMGFVEEKQEALLTVIKFIKSLSS
jgi:pimeloyl-ACP methyl ester carboxylesterase